MVKFWIFLIQQITCIVPWILGFSRVPFISPQWQNFVLSNRIQLIHVSEGLVEGSLFPVSISRPFPPNHGKLFCHLQFIHLSTLFPFIFLAQIHVKMTYVKELCCKTLLLHTKSYDRRVALNAN